MLTPSVLSCAPSLSLLVAAVAESIRLVLASQGVEFENEQVDPAAMKADAERFPFGQVGRGACVFDGGPMRLQACCLHVLVLFCRWPTALSHPPSPHPTPGTAQCPRYRDEEVDLTQCHAILRHLGRKHGL